MEFDQEAILHDPRAVIISQLQIYFDGRLNLGFMAVHEDPGSYFTLHSPN